MIEPAMYLENGYNSLCKRSEGKKVHHTQYKEGNSLFTIVLGWKDLAQSFKET